MEIIIGKTAGFCYGVKRAVEGSLKETSDKQIYCLGELVHNKQVMNEIEKQGIKLIEDINEVPNNSKVIIRAHGVVKEVYEIAKEKNIELVDYTCPNVLKIHEVASKYKKENYYIFVIGNKTHPETIGTISYCGNNYSCIETEDDINDSIESLKESKIKDLLIIVQTTFSEAKFKLIKEKIEETINDINIVVKNTICAATSTRQKETENLSKEVDCMIIIGGKNSSNTKKLYELAEKNCQKAIAIETKEELNKEDLLKYKKIGIMAGASTPKKNIDEVVELLNN